jgi:sugar phosphate isomerase/epimerase
LVLAAGSLLDQPAAVVIESAAAVGFDAVGLRLSGEHAVADPSALAGLASSVGVAIHDCEVYRIDTTHRDPRPLLEAAATAGASSLLVVSDLDDRTATVDRLAELTSLARPLGVEIGVEYMAWTHPSDPLGAIDVATGSGCVVVVDLLHHLRVGAGAEELDAIVASGRLGWVQLCDAAAPVAALDREALIAEARHHRLPPGSGALALRPLLDLLGPDVTISVEVQSDELLRLPARERARLLFDTSAAVLGQSPSSTG